MVMQGYGATECGPASVNTKQDHGLGTVGKPIEGFEVQLSPENEILMRGPIAVPGLLARPGGDEGGADGGWLVPHRGHRAVRRRQGHLILMGRTKDIIVLPTGSTCTPRTSRTRSRIAGLRDSVVMETRPGRIEAVVLAPGSPGLPRARRPRLARRPRTTRRSDPTRSGGS